MKKIATTARPIKTHFHQIKTKMAANNVSNIHVSADVLSTLLSLQQGNLVDLPQQNLLDISQSTLQEITQPEPSLTIAQQQLQEEEMQPVAEGSEDDIERVYFVILLTSHNSLFGLPIVPVFHYKLPSMVG